MLIDPKQQSKQDNYKLLIGSVLPRPIAFVTSMSQQGVVNAAPFSFFNVVGTEPPLISFACIRKPGGVMKDTARNITETKEFVVHVVDGDNVSVINDTSIDFPPDVSEADALKLPLAPSSKVKVPRMVHSKIQMECRLHQWIPLGGETEAPNTDLIIGEVVMFHIADELYEHGKIDTVQLDPISRLAGTTYGKIGEMFSMPRLPYVDWLDKQK